MEDQAQTQASYSAELQALRQRIAELEATQQAHPRTAALPAPGEADLRLALDAARVGVWDWDIAGGRVVWSERLEAIFGFPAGAFAGVHAAYLQRVYPDDLPALQRAIDAALSRDPPEYTIEHRIILPDRRVRWVESRGRVAYDDHDRPARMTGIMTDITARKQAEAALRESKERFRSLWQDVDLGMLLYGPQTELLLINQAALELLGLHEEHVLGKTLRELNWNLIHEDGSPLAPDEHPVVQAIADRRPLRDAVVGLHRPLTQELIWLLISVVPQLAPDGGLRHVVCSFINITARKHTEAALRGERDLLTGIMNTSVAAITVFDPDGNIVFANDRAEQLLGLSRADPPVRADDAPPAPLAGDSPPLYAQELFRRIIDAGQPVFDLQHVLTISSGDLKYLSISGAPIKNADGAITSVVFSINDITELKQAEAAVRESEERYRAISESVSDYAYAYRVEDDGAIVYEWVTDAFTRITGYTAHDLAAPNYWNSVVYPEDRAILEQATQRLFAGQSSAIEYRIFSRGDRLLWLRHYNRPVWNVDRSRVIRVFGAAQDITKLRQLEQQLNQSQKMEAIGRLAGGIAHDFNNLLTVILGNSGMLLDELVERHPMRHDIDQIQQAAERAAALTHQLLAFSRRQVLQPQTLDLNAVVTNMAKMLHRLIGEDVELVTKLKPGLGFVQADPGQIEQVMMNLAINARDAMPGGGTLTIETATIYLDAAHSYSFGGAGSGAYVLLAVSDTGCGMDAATQGLIFEPFFTTKEPGKGTGLGLSTVHGIINQSGGHIWVYSELGHGTTFKIYLPQVEQVGAEIQPTPYASLPQHDNGTILLVEDDPQVRALASRVLQARGYEVLEAGDGQAALLAASRHEGQIDLLVTDVIMPGGMNGRQLAEHMVVLRPDIRILYISGYTDSTMAQLRLLDPGRAFLQKPFTQTALAGKVWEVLHS